MNRISFINRGYAFKGLLAVNMGSMVVPIRADQLLPQFMLKPFDSLPPQYRHTGYVHEEILFWNKKIIACS